MNLLNITTQQPTCKSFHPTLGVAFKIVFQPILKMDSNKPFGYEAILCGSDGEPASTLLAQLDQTKRCEFVQAYRLDAIRLAYALGLEGALIFSLMPKANCLHNRNVAEMLNAVMLANKSANQIIFQISNDENMKAISSLSRTFSTLKSNFFNTAIDGFGAGYASLKVLQTLKPSIIKIDPSLLRNIDEEPNKSVILAIVELCNQLNIQVIANGVNTKQELDALAKLNINFFQGIICTNLPILDA